MKRHFKINKNKIGWYVNEINASEIDNFEETISIESRDFMEFINKLKLEGDEVGKAVAVSLKAHGIDKNGGGSDLNDLKP